MQLLAPEHAAVVGTSGAVGASGADSRTGTAPEPDLGTRSDAAPYGIDGATDSGEHLLDQAPAGPTGSELSALVAEVTALRAEVAALRVLIEQLQAEEATRRAVVGQLRARLSP